MSGSGFDSRFHRHVRAGLLILATAVLGFGLIACGGGDDEEDAPSPEATSTAAASGGSSSNSGGATATTASSGSSSGGGATVGTEKGNQIATAAMLVTGDLPGTGWQETSRDDFGASLLDTDEDDLSDTPACNAYVKAMTDAVKKAEEAQVGRAARGFQQEGDQFFGLSVDADVTVYKDSKTSAALITAAKGAFGSRDFENCFREVIKGAGGDIPEEVKFELKAATPLTSVPNNGVAQAYDVSLSSAGITFELHAELYAWSEKNAVAFVSFFGDPKNVKAAVVKAAVSKTDERLSKAQ